MNWERSEHTLSATALVNAAYVRLRGARSQNWDSRGHFFSAAAEAMRRVLIEHARARGCAKRSGTRATLDLDTLPIIEPSPCLLLDFDEALCQLELEDTDAAALGKLRVFAGLNNTHAGSRLGLAQYSAYRMWEFVQAWFAAWEQQGTSTLVAPPRCG